MSQTNLAKGLNESDLKVFLESITHYFLHLTQEPVDIRAAYLAEKEVPSFDYTGLITVSGCFRGYVYFSASKALIRRLLHKMHEPNTDDDNILDAVGEIANTISGNVRRHFGSALEISVPSAIKGSIEHLKASVRTRPFVIQLAWKGGEAVLFVDLEVMA